MTASHRARPGRSLNVTLSIRIFIVAVIAFAAVIGWVLFLLINANASLDRYVKTAHSQRVAIQANTQEQIRSLACLVVKPFPDNAGPLIKEIREKYDCPPFSGTSPVPTSRATTPVRGAGHPKPGAITVTSGNGVVAVARGGGGIHVVTRTVHAPQPSSSHRPPVPSPTPVPTRPTVKPTPHPTAAAPILQLGDRTCAVGVVGICVLGR